MNLLPQVIEKLPDPSKYKKYGKTGLSVFLILRSLYRERIMAGDFGGAYALKQIFKGE